MPSTSTTERTSLLWAPPGAAGAADAPAGEVDGEGDVDSVFDDELPGAGHLSTSKAGGAATAAAPPLSAGGGYGWSIFASALPPAHGAAGGFTFDWKSVVFTALSVFANTAENASLPLWIGAAGPALGGPYFILLFTSIAFTIVFGSLALVHWVFFRCPAPSFREYWYFFCAVGFLDSANGLLLVYASPADRTPPLLQAILPSTGILFALVATRVLVPRRDSPISYAKPWPILALILIMGGIVVSLVPTVQADVASGQPVFSSGSSGLVWAGVFTLGIAPSGVLSVVQEAFLKRRKRATRGLAERSLWFDITVMLAYSCFFQLFFVVAFFWVDIIPGYGFSSSVGDLLHSTGSAFACFLQVSAVPGAHCPAFLGLGSLFTGAFVVAYLASSALNNTSANYSVIASALVSPLTAAFWLSFPQLNANAANTPVAYVLPSLAALFAGTIAWKLYENREIRAHTRPALLASNAAASNSVHRVN